MVLSADHERLYRRQLRSLKSPQFNIPENPPCCPIHVQHAEQSIQVSRHLGLPLRLLRVRYTTAGGRVRAIHIRYRGGANTGTISPQRNKGAGTEICGNAHGRGDDERLVLAFDRHTNRF